MSLTSPHRGYPLEKIDGSAGSMATWVRTFDNVADSLAQLDANAQTVTDLRGEGDSVTEVRSDAQALIAPARSAMVEARLLSRVLSDYADAFSASAEPANRMIDEIEDAHAAWEHAVADAEQAESNSQFLSRLVLTEAAISGAEQDARDARSASGSAKAALDVLWERWEAYYSAWDEAYDAAVSALSSGALQALSTRERALLDALLGANGAAAVLALWNSNPELAALLAEQCPDIIGNLDGVPYDVRAAANLRLLMGLHDNLDSLEEPLRSEVAALWSAVVDHGGHLVSFDPRGSGQMTAALWYGPFDAKNVSTLVPGMGSAVAGISGWGASARELVDGTSDAAIAWFGYDSPSIGEERSISRADGGAPALGSFLLGLDGRSGQRTVNVIAHSYGSTTAAFAIGSAPDGLGVGRFITVGSAGLPDDHGVLANLQSPEAPRIYATTADGDVVAPIGRLTSQGHGTAPTSLDGAVDFDSDGGVGTSGEALRATPGHGSGGYLRSGSESFYNVRSIVTTGSPGTEAGGEGSTSVDGRDFIRERGMYRHY